jgi:hypothetical protein
VLLDYIPLLPDQQSTHLGKEFVRGNRGGKKRNTGIGRVRGGKKQWNSHHNWNNPQWILELINMVQG